MQCTNDDCEIWLCLKSVADGYNLIAAELQMLNEREHSFKCRECKAEELDLKQSITNLIAKANASHYIFGKKARPCGQLQDDSSEDHEFLFKDETEENEQDSKLTLAQEINKKKAPPRKKEISSKKENSTKESCCHL